MTCLMAFFFCAMSFERYDAVYHVCIDRRNRLLRPRKLLACGTMRNLKITVQKMPPLAGTQAFSLRNQA